MSPPRADALLDIRPRGAAALFDTFCGPGSGGERLDPGAASRLLDLAQGLPSGAAPALRITLPEPPPPGLEDRLRAALRRAAEAEDRALRELFRGGRKALAVGLGVLATCLTLAVQGAELFQRDATVKVFTEGLTIIGWVSMWKPIEICVYDWMPIVRRRRLLRALAAGRIELREG